MKNETVKECFKKCSFFADNCSFIAPLQQDRSELEYFVAAPSVEVDPACIDEDMVCYNTEENLEPDILSN